VDRREEQGLGSDAPVHSLISEAGGSRLRSAMLGLLNVVVDVGFNGVEFTRTYVLTNSIKR